MVTRKKSSYLRRQYTRRLKKVSFIKDLPLGIEKLDSPISRKDFPIGQLAKAKMFFGWGFYEECILNATFAVEYGLLIKLDEELGAETKQAIAQKQKGLALSKAMDMSVGKWIDVSFKDDLEVLNNLRNMTAHPANWISLYSQLNNYYENPTKAKKWVYEATEQDCQQIEKNFAGKFDTTKGEEAIDGIKAVIATKFSDLPDVSWAAKKVTLNFQLKKILELVKPVAVDLINKKKVIGLTKQPKLASKYLVATYKFQETLAFEALKIAHNVLCQIGFTEPAQHVHAPKT